MQNPLAKAFVLKMHFNVKTYKIHFPFTCVHVYSNIKDISVIILQKV